MNTHEILVTGGTGSLGSRVVNRLSEAGENVRVMSRYWHANTIRGDLLTGEGLEEAVEGVNTIIHCASSSLRRTRQVDVDGTRRLLQAAERTGVSHILFISIVGVDRNPYFPYYRMKLETERIIEHSEVPWTILRATQFHGFVLRLIQALDRLPMMVAPRGFLLQPIDVGEVAYRSAELALAGPAGRAPDVGGPEVLAFADLARAYFEAAGRRRRVVEVPLLGKVSRALREGRRRRRSTGTARSAGKNSWRSIKSRAKGTMKGGAFVSSDRGSRPVRRGLLRGGLLLLAATPLFGGIWALILPRSFYVDFPLPGSDWVSTLGPYNEHLIRDYGALNLALAILLVAAALLLERRVVQVALVTWLVYATPHLVFHIGQTDHFSARSNVEQLGGLGLVVLLPLLLLFSVVPLGSKNAPGNTIRPER